MQDQILTALKAVQDPDLHKDIVALGFVKDVKACDGVVAFPIELTSQVRASKSEQKDKLVPLVKNIVPVASGKGGVGKSTVSANLAVALAKMGCKVGLMDADVYGPSIPTIMGADTPPTSENGRIIPPIRYGVKIVSMGF